MNKNSYSSSRKEKGKLNLFLRSFYIQRFDTFGHISKTYNEHAQFSLTAIKHFMLYCRYWEIQVYEKNKNMSKNYVKIIFLNLHLKKKEKKFPPPSKHGVGLSSEEVRVDNKAGVIDHEGYALSTLRAHVLRYGRVRLRLAGLELVKVALEWQIPRTPSTDTVVTPRVGATVDLILSLVGSFIITAATFQAQRPNAVHKTWFRTWRT